MLRFAHYDEIWSFKSTFYEKHLRDEEEWKSDSCWADYKLSELLMLDFICSLKHLSLTLKYFQ